MSYSGYPTPDTDPNQEFINVCIAIPSSVGDVFYQVLLGQISEMANDYYWKQDGTMTPEECAFLWSQTLALTPADLTECLTMTCEDVADCIENDVAVQNALQTYLESKGYGSAEGTPLSPSVYNSNEPLLDGSLIAGCDNNNLFGGVTQLVDLMNTMLEDFFEYVEGLTEGAERWGAVLEAIPITNILAIDDLIQFADQLIENIGQSYTAEYTATLRDEFRCDLFCLVKDTCELDFQAWADYFMDLLGQSITENAFDNTIAWFTGGNFSNEEIVYAGHAIICQVFAYGSKFFGFDMVWFGKVVTAAMNDPDSDWTILCDECPDFQTAEWDFTVTDGGFIQNNGSFPRGAYSSGIGWITEYNGNEGLIIQLALPANFQLKSLSFDWTKNTAQNWTLQAYLRDNPNSGTGQVFLFNTSSTALANCTYGTLGTETHRDYLLLAFSGGTVATMEGIIDKCRIEYMGDTPLLVTSTGGGVVCP